MSLKDNELVLCLCRELYVVPKLLRLPVIHLITSEGRRAVLKPRPTKVIQKRQNVSQFLVTKKGSLVASLSRKGIYYGILGSSRDQRNKLRAEIPKTPPRTSPQNNSSITGHRAKPLSPVPSPVPHIIYSKVTCLIGGIYITCQQHSIQQKWELEQLEYRVYLRLWTATNDRCPYSGLFWVIILFICTVE